MLSTLIGMALLLEAIADISAASLFSTATNSSGSSPDKPELFDRYLFTESNNFNRSGSE